MLKKEYQNLSTEEKLDLVEELWESIRQDANIELSDAHKKELKRRQDEVLSGKAKLLSWDEVMERVKKK
jgi:putative addiction module component (TIGR02574 family)